MASEVKVKQGYMKVPLSAMTIIAIVLAIYCVLEYKQTTQLQAQLTLAQARINQLGAGLQQANKLDIPITVFFRRAVFGDGLVAVFRNNSGSQLEAAADVTSQATNARKHIELVLPANGTQEVGPQQGWPFAPGQKITLSNNSFRSIIVTVPVS